MRRHEELRAQWKQGQVWETRLDECPEWVLVGNEGKAEPMWDQRQEYRQRMPSEGEPMQSLRRVQMPTYETLTYEQQQIASAMADAARGVLRAHFLAPPMDDRAAAFEEACAVLLADSRIVGGGGPPSGGQGAS